MFFPKLCLQFFLKLYIRSNFLKRDINYVENNKCTRTLMYSYGREVRSDNFREKHTHRVFQNRVLGNIFGSKRQEVTGEWRRLHDRGLTTSTLYQILLGSSSQRDCEGRDA
jgi:hypothetical protein